MRRPNNLTKISGLALRWLWGRVRVYQSGVIAYGRDRRSHFDHVAHAKFEFTFPGPMFRYAIYVPRSSGASISAERCLISRIESTPFSQDAAHLYPCVDLGAKDQFTFQFERHTSPRLRTSAVRSTTRQPQRLVLHVPCHAFLSTVLAFHASLEASYG